VIILTAQISLGESVKAIRDGARGIILKHAASEFLIKGLRKVFEGELWADSSTMTQVVESLSRKFRVDRGPEKGRKELSERETEVVALVASGNRNKEIAANCYQRVNSTNKHFQAQVNYQGLAYAMRNGLG
jgi:DNA-binding NarL/FixJ family response regulator